MAERIVTGFLAGRLTEDEAKQLLSPTAVETWRKRKRLLSLQRDVDVKSQDHANAGTDFNLCTPSSICEKRLGACSKRGAPALTLTNSCRLCIVVIAAQCSRNKNEDAVVHEFQHKAAQYRQSEHEVASLVNARCVVTPPRKCALLCL